MSARAPRATTAPRRPSKSTEGSITYNEWSFAQEQHLGVAKIITSAGPDPVAISTDSVGKTIASAFIIKKGNDLALDMISFYRPNDSGAYPIVLATYEIVCTNILTPNSVGRQGIPAAHRRCRPEWLGGQRIYPCAGLFKSWLSNAVNAIS